MAVCAEILKFVASTTVFLFVAFLTPLAQAQEGLGVGEAQEISTASTTNEASSTEALPVEPTVASTPTPSYTIEALNNADIIGDFVVGPGKTELRLKPGESRTVELVISNRMGEPRQFNFEVEDVTGSANGDQAVVLLGDDRGPYTLKDYVKLPAEHFDLGHAERARVPVTITIPLDAEPGGRYGSVLVTTVTKSSRSQTDGAVPKSAIISRVGTLFFVVIEGDAAVEGKLERFESIPAKNWFAQGPIRFGLYYKNSGSIHLNPYGELRVENMFGEEVGFMQIEPWFALPQSLRFREIEWTREFLLGKYKAVVHINRGYDDVVDTMEYEFWVLPWKVIGFGLLGVFAFFFVIRLFFKTFEFKRKGSG